jgi:hypothetical protein
MAASVTFFVVSLMVTFTRAAARSTAEARDVVAGTAAENSGSRFRKMICEMEGLKNANHLREFAVVDQAGSCELHSCSKRQMDVLQQRRELGPIYRQIF